MHFDHISGLSDFPRAKVHVHKREDEAFTAGKIRKFTEFAYIPCYIAHKPEFGLYDKIDSKWYDFDAIRLPFEPEMYFIPLFGHSRGQCGLPIKTSTGWFFHAAAGAIYNNETPEWLIRWVLGPHDPVLRAFMRSHPEVIITNSHMFPEFFEQHPTVIWFSFVGWGVIAAITINYRVSDGTEAAPRAWYMPEKIWLSLTPDQKKAFVAAAKTGGAVVTQLGEKIEKDGLVTFKENGVTVSQPDRAAFEATLKDAYKQSEGKLWAPGLVEQIRALPNNK